METKTMPLMDTIKALQAANPGKVLLYRLGDFYEAFGKDADIVSQTCGCAVVGKGVQRMSGVMIANFDTAIKALVDAGYYIAVCEPAPTEQTE